MKSLKSISLIVFCSIVSIVSLTAILLHFAYIRIGEDNIEHLLKLMYNFKSQEEVLPDADDPSGIKNYLTDDVYNQLIEPEETLRRYTKTTGSSCTILIEDITPTYVTFTLDCDSITSTRKFMVMYKVNWQGKISYLRECEIVDFY